MSPQLMECEGLPPIQLYDLDNDIGEQRNVYDKHPEVAEELKALLTKYVENGRSTPGTKQGNTGPVEWEQLWWMLTRTPKLLNHHEPALFMKNLLQARIAPQLRPGYPHRQFTVCLHGCIGDPEIQPAPAARSTLSRRSFMNNAG